MFVVKVKYRFTGAFFVWLVSFTGGGGGGGGFFFFFS